MMLGRLQFWLQGKRENELLRVALLEQWLDAHADHCCERWPHPGICHWPPPPVLGDPVRLAWKDYAARIPEDKDA